MFDLSVLIGKTTEEAIELLKENGFFKIETKQNFKHNDKCDTKLVCSASINGDVVTLVEGEFCLNIEGNDVI